MAIQLFPLDSDNNESMKYTSAMISSMLGSKVRSISDSNVTYNPTTKVITVNQFRGIANGVLFNITGESVTATSPTGYQALVYTVDKSLTSPNGKLSLKTVEPTAYKPAYTDAGSTEIFIGTFNAFSGKLLVHDRSSFVVDSAEILVSNFNSLRVDNVFTATQNDVAIALRLSTPYTYQKREQIIWIKSPAWSDQHLTRITNGDNVATGYSTILTTNVSKYTYSTLNVSTSDFGTNFIASLSSNDEFNTYLIDTSSSGNSTNKTQYAFYKVDGAKVANLKMTVTVEPGSILWLL